MGSKPLTLLVVVLVFTVTGCYAVHEEGECGDRLACIDTTTTPEPQRQEAHFEEHTLGLIGGGAEDECGKGAACVVNEAHQNPKRQDKPQAIEYQVKRNGTLIIDGDVLVSCDDLLKFDNQVPTDNPKVRAQMQQSRRERVKACTKAGFPPDKPSR